MGWPSAPEHGGVNASLESLASTVDEFGRGHLQAGLGQAGAGRGPIAERCSTLGSTVKSGLAFAFVALHQPIGSSMQ